MKGFQLAQSLRHFISGILPSRCISCGSQSATGYCRRCYLLLPRIVHRCYQCGKVLTRTSRCGQCLNAPPPFKSSFIPFVYSPPVSAAIQKLKFHQNFAAGRALAEAFVESFESKAAHYPEVLVPIPLHSKRLRQRGFNQSLFLAKTIGLGLGISVDPHLLKRTRHTEPQSNLMEKQRKENVKDAFALAFRPPGYGHIALVDDVVTSGNTVRAAAKILKRSGIHEISIWAIAKTRQ